MCYDLMRGVGFGFMTEWFMIAEHSSSVRIIEDKSSSSSHYHVLTAHPTQHEPIILSKYVKNPRQGRSKREKTISLIKL